jgi:hypothetical protein
MPLSSSAPRSDRPPSTVVCSHLDTDHQPGVNLVWAAAIDVAWKRLVQLADGPIRIAGAHSGDPVLRIMEELNASPIEAGALDPAWFVAEAGPVTGGAHARDVDPDGIVLRSDFAMTPRFVPPLARSPWPSFYRGQKLQCFGVWWSPGEPEARWRERNAQAIVHFSRYTDEELAELSEAEVDAAYNQFVVELRTADPRLSVVVAAIPPDRTFRRTLDGALSHLQDHDAHPRARFTAEEGLSLPVIDVACASASLELAGRSIDNPPLRGRRFGPIEQAIRFHLDEGGAAAPLPSHSLGLMSPRRRFGCVVSFLVAVVHRQRRLPIFALWVENTDVLVKASAVGGDAAKSEPPSCDQS